MQPRRPNAGVSILFLALLLLVVVAFASCSKPSATATAVNTNEFYLIGLAEGKKHVKERPEVSLTVLPAEATNWSKASLEQYHAGYVAGLSAP